MGFSGISINADGFGEVRSCTPPGTSLRALEAASLLQINPAAASRPGCLFSKAPPAPILPALGQWGETAARGREPSNYSAADLTRRPSVPVILDPV